MTTNGAAVGIKGFREGLLVSLGQGEYDHLLRHLAQELAEKKEFLKGSRVTLDVGQRPLSRTHLARLQSLFEQDGLELWTVLAAEETTKDAARGLGLATRLPGSQTDLDGNALEVMGAPEPAAAVEPPLTSPSCLFLKETVRSGRSIYHEGDVVVIGDVNPGAEIIASGDVIVWGRLRGLVHAGALGNMRAIICALDLTPTQLRIADQIAIAPESGKRPLPQPEQAAIRNGQIIASPWSSRG